MTLTKEQKQAIISEHATHDGDTGSPEVQVAVLTAEILTLAAHLETHRKDHHSRRGLLVKVGRRNRLLRYLRGKSTDRYQSLIQALGLRR